MLAVLLREPGSLDTSKVPVPDVGPGELLLKVGAASVCGTDLRIVQAGLPKGASYPRILGHEVAGVVEKIGPGVVGFNVGCRVAVAPNIGCGACDSCVRGDSHQCLQCTAIGIAIDGGFAQYLLIPSPAVHQGNVVPIPEGVSYEEAAVNEALACCYNGMETCRPTPGDVITIIGAGPIGLMHSMIGRLYGASKVIVSDINQNRLAKARELLPFLITLGADELEARVSKETGGMGSDIVIVACPSAVAQEEAVELSATRGRINFFGGLPPGEEMVRLNSNTIHYKQLTLTGTTRSNTRQFRTTLKWIGSRQIDVRPVITDRVRLAELPAAFERLRLGVGLKTVVLP